MPSNNGAHLSHDFTLTAHRGAVDRAPENTLLAFTAAEELGFREAELDVQLTRDGVLVLSHDRTLRRVARDSSPFAGIPIEALGLDELQSVDLGLGQRVPTFADVLDHTALNLQVEIKAPRAAHALAEFLRTRSAEDRARCRVSSFDPFSLRVFHDTGVQLERGSALLVADVLSDWPYIVDELPVTNLLLHWPGLTREIVEHWRGRGYGVCASMFNDAGDLQRVLETGVDGSSTDRPLLALSLLAEVRDRQSDLQGHSRGFANLVLDPQGNPADSVTGIPQLTIADVGTPPYYAADQGGFFHFGLLHVNPDGTVQFAVEPLLKSVAIDQGADDALAVGETKQYTATAVNTNGANIANPPVIPVANPMSHVWTSSNTAVATVDAVTGEVTATGAGSATISVQAGGITTSLELTVSGQ
ncbi:Ig-like domain-containing protein [Tessaracoccus sp. OS52]|uniref:glycerophosphodiester phosphodiesterase family protein n=1 Tax=Tessaracoccus sp. OS52 TaxID=2886691 RepID=UPI001D12B650|nr:glycerophosphodiester phosphodiesterase family protein [Tessaracoccus sp. OS52]MCC2594435.1 Ig-like domain-containing protein [Tessaracoccus sp. OS52]